VKKHESVDSKVVSFANARVNASFSNAEVDEHIKVSSEASNRFHRAVFDGVINLLFFIFRTKCFKKATSDNGKECNYCAILRGLFTLRNT